MSSLWLDFCVNKDAVALSVEFWEIYWKREA